MLKNSLISSLPFLQIYFRSSSIQFFLSALPVAPQPCHTPGCLPLVVPMLILCLAPVLSLRTVYRRELQESQSCVWNLTGIFFLHFFVPHVLPVKKSSSHVAQNGKSFDSLFKDFPFTINLCKKQEAQSRKEWWKIPECHCGRFFFILPSGCGQY